MSQLSPYSISAFLSPEECEVIKDHTHKTEMNAGKLSGAKLEQSIRSAQTLWLDDDIFPWLTERLIQKISQIAFSEFSFDITGLDEGAQLLKYQGEDTDGPSDFYDWHMDIGHSGSSKSRKLTAIIQLSTSDSYMGGDLDVNYDGTAHSLDKNIGTMIVFPSFMLHRVTPVLTGERFSLAVWAHGPAFQ